MCVCVLTLHVTGKRLRERGREKERGVFGRFLIDSLFQTIVAREKTKINRVNKNCSCQKISFET